MRGLTATGWSHVINRKTQLTVGSNFRTGPSTDSGVIKVFPAGTALVPFGDARGAPVGDNDHWLACELWVDTTTDGRALGRTVVGFFHTSVVAPLSAIEAAGITEDEANAREAKAAGLAARFVAGAAAKAAEGFKG